MSRSRLLLRPIAFSVGFSTACVVGLATAREYSYQKEMDRMNDRKEYLKNLFQFKTPYQQQQLSEFQRLKLVIKNQWDTMTPGKKTCMAILGINSIIFFAWQIPRFQPFMMRHFTHVPASGRSYTLITSAFSHENGLHFLMNSMAMYSFWPLLQDSRRFSPEQMIAFYLSSSVFASLSSHTFSVLARRSLLIPSLGASGGLWALLTLTESYYPNLSVGIMLLPFSFSLGTLVPCLMLLDTVGLIRGWKMFDHAAHLGGAAVGYLYSYYGPQAWLDFRRIIQKRLQSPEGS